MTDFRVSSHFYWPLARWRCVRACDIKIRYWNYYGEQPIENSYTYNQPIL